MLKQRIPLSFCILFCSLHPHYTFAQSTSTVTSTADITISDSTLISLRNLSLENFASLDASTSTLVIDSSDPSNPVHIGGERELAFHSVLLTGEKSAGLELTSDLTITGELQLEEGTLDLNQHSIYLGEENGKIVGESEKSYVFGEGSILKVVHLNHPEQEEPGQLGIRISSKKNLGKTLIKRTHTKGELADGDGVLRQFEVLPEFNTDLDATVELRYLDTELHGLEESELSIWSKEEYEWEELGVKKLNTNQNWAEIRKVQSLNTLSLALGNEGQQKASSPLPAPTTSIENDKLAEIQINTYPNPTPDVLKLELQDGIIGTYELDFLSPNGTIVKRLQLQNDSPLSFISMSDLAEGVYILRIQTPQQEIHHFEILKL